MVQAGAMAHELRTSGTRRRHIRPRPTFTSSGRAGATAGSGQPGYFPAGAFCPGATAGTMSKARLMRVPGPLNGTVRW